MRVPVGLIKSMRCWLKPTIQSSALSIFRSVVRDATFLVGWASPLYHKVADVQVHIEKSLVVRAAIEIASGVDGRQRSVVKWTGEIL